MSFVSLLVPQYALRKKWNDICIFTCRAPIFQDLVLAARGVYHKPLAQSLDKAIKQVFPDKPKHEIKIVDAGAGTGLIGIELQKLGYTDVCALDISQGMLNEAKKTNAYKKFICAALSDQRIPEIETGEFHALICGGTMLSGHIRPTALVEMIRMVKIGTFH